jgi:hypothetical protein
MRVHEKYIDFNFQHRNKSNSKCFNNRSKIFILHDNKFVNQRFSIFNFLENVLNDELVNDRRSNHYCAYLSDFNENCVSCRD